MNAKRAKAKHPPCYISPTTPRGCSVSHLQHEALSVWFNLYSLVGAETSIAQALPLLDRAGATPQDYDVILAIRSWIREAQDEKMDRERAT